MRFFKVVLFIAALIIYGESFAHKTYPTGSLLWEISGKDLTAPSYLLGTFHLKSGSYMDSIAGAKKAFESSEQVIGEVSLDNMQEIQMKMMMKMQMPQGANYRQLYSDDDYEFVNKQLISYMGAGLDKLGSLQPAALDMTIFTMVYIKNIGNFNPLEALDMYIQSKAAKKGKAIAGLETADSQITLLTESPLQRQADLLLCHLKNTDQIVSTELKKLIEGYNKADLHLLNELFTQVSDENNPCPDTEEELNRMLKDRNNNWMKQLPALMKEKPSFIAVGAGHLVGEYGLLNLLEQAGYKVKAVTK
ncbi:MAG: TraB/GumN family protein [Dysgonamonadaceae bacterium]|jgi:uncharacterized protein YbaP (TraB family)|nr:TraB/GumN family protein [Dysgonamonadaceae bacterium]